MLPASNVFLDQSGFDMPRRTNFPFMLVLIPLVWFSMGSGPPEDTYPRQPGIDAIHYAFRITLQDDSDRIVAEADVAIQFLHQGVTDLALDLASVSEASNGAGMTVSGVTSGRETVRWEHDANRLLITLDEPPEVGETRTFTVRYAGIAAEGLNIGPNRYGERTFFSVNWPDKARHWLPMIDHPYDKATSEFIANVSEPFRRDTASRTGQNQLRVVRRLVIGKSIL